MRESGLATYRLLERGDPSRVLYSLTLSERSPEGNRIRVQTDNFNGPFNVNEGSRIELGSTAKLRTLVTYLQMVEGLFEEMSALPLTPFGPSTFHLGTTWAAGRWTSSSATLGSMGPECSALPWNAGIPQTQVNGL